MIPVFPELAQRDMGEWIPSTRWGIVRLLKRVVSLQPDNVIIQDQAWWQKIVIAIALRLIGIRVAMRSDKNIYSTSAHNGIKLILERYVVRCVFNVLCPVSELTSDYYNWSDNNRQWFFPYCTKKSKFIASPDLRNAGVMARPKLGIPCDSFVFISVIKFVERENPLGVIKVFEHVVRDHPNAWLVMVGSGPQHGECQSYVAKKSIPNIRFVGYIPYPELQEYFHLSNVFVQLARSEPWGISPQDALVADLGLIVSNNVGSGVVHLKYDLERFVVDVDDIDIIALRMSELIMHENVPSLFKSAKDRVMMGYTADSLAAKWAHQYLL